MVKEIHRLPGTGQPRLEMRHLLMIQAIARTGNLTRAAEALAVTPSALSHRLGEAERRLGRKLCDRAGRRVTLTPAGEMILRAADQALELMAQAEADVARLHGGAHERALRLTVGHYGSYDWFAEFLCGWQAAHASVHVYVRADAQCDPVAALREGRVDVAILPYRPREPDVTAHPLFEDELVFICPPDDPLAQAEWIEGADLEGRTFLTYTRVVVPDQEFERFIRPSGARTDQWLDMEDPAVIAALVARGRGVSILSRWAMQNAIASGRIAAVPITREGLKIGWSVAVKQGAEEDAALMALVAGLQASFQTWPERF